MHIKWLLINLNRAFWDKSLKYSLQALLYKYDNPVTYSHTRVKNIV